MSTPFGETGLNAQHAISDAILSQCEYDVYGLPCTPAMSPMEYAWRALVALDDAGYKVVKDEG